ncbi:MAG: hypothetical protein GYA62_06580 [Bacteroidales bacterium]|nr:hypothetical protein [Bacteroidales bacterium]
MRFKFPLLFIGLVLFLLIMDIAVFAQEPSKIYFFYGTGCPHCAQVEQYFEKNDIFAKYPVEKKEIYFNHDNAVLFNRLLDNLKFPNNNRGIPTIIIGNKVLTGDKEIIDNFLSEADIYLKENSNNLKSLENKKEISTPTLDLTIGAVIVGSLVDAINPCEFAVLILLMTTILASGNAKRALKAGLAFTTSIFISYFLMGLGLYHALTYGGVSHWFFKIVGWLAIVLGFLNLKDYFWYGKGVLMEVPLSWRPHLKKIIGSVTSVAGAFSIGFLVSLFLLPCTSGPYIVILGMLAKKVLSVKAILYLLLYNLIFISPMVLISIAVYRGFNPTKAEQIRQKKLRLLHLIAGIIMLVMGVIIIAGLI